MNKNLKIIKGKNKSQWRMHTLEYFRFYFFIELKFFRLKEDSVVKSKLNLFSI